MLPKLKVPGVMRIALGAEKSERIMQDHTAVLERAAHEQQERAKRPHWKLARTSLNSRGAEIARRGREKLSELGGTRGAAWKPRDDSSLKTGLAALPDEAFVFDGSSSDEDEGYESDTSMLSVRSDGVRILPPRIHGKERHTLSIVDPPAPAEVTDPVSVNAQRKARPRGVVRLVQDVVDGVVEDIKQWHTLPFDTVAEKCEYIATRDERLPTLLMMFTILLGIIILVVIGFSHWMKKTRPAALQDQRVVAMLQGGGGIPAAHSRSRFSNASTVSVQSGNPFFHLVPLA